MTVIEARTLVALGAIVRQGRPEGITSQSRYTSFRPSDCPNNPDHLSP